MVILLFIQIETPQHVNFVYLVPHGITRWRVPVEVDVSGSGGFGVRVSWGRKVTSRRRRFLVYEALLLHLGNLWRFRNCRKWKGLENETFTRYQALFFFMNDPFCHLIKSETPETFQSPFTFSLVPMSLRQMTVCPLGLTSIGDIDEGGLPLSNRGVATWVKQFQLEGLRLDWAGM